MAAAAVRRDHPGQVAGRRAGGRRPRNTPASPLHRMLLGAPARRTPRCRRVRRPDRRRGRRAPRRWRDGRRPVARAAPCRADPGADPPRPAVPALAARDLHPRRSTSPGGAPPTPRSPPSRSPAGRRRRRAASPRTVGQGRRGRSSRSVTPTLAEPDGRAGGPVPSPMADLPVGRDVRLPGARGARAHRPGRARPARGAARATSTSSSCRWPVDLDREELADALVAVCDSPLGPLARDHPARDPAARPAARDGVRAAAGRRRPGRPRRRRTPRRPRPAAARATCPTATRSAAYADALDRPGARRPDACAATSPARSTSCSGLAGPRYLIVDYKTNWLRPGATARSPRDAYRPEALDAAMGHSDYPLQALLYAAVLHRFLRWRQPGYDPETAPRRRALPLPARHVRPRHPARRRRAVRRLLVAAAGRPGRGAVRPAATVPRVAR